MENQKSSSVWKYWRLFVAHSCYTWTDRSWEIAWVLFIAKAFPDTLLPVSLFGLVVNACGIVAGGRAGSIVDAKGRWEVVRGAIILANAMVVVASALFAYLPNIQIEAWKYVVLAATIICGICIKLASIPYVIAVERDWVVVLANGDQELLSNINSMIRRVDLLCKLVAPLIFSVFTSVAVFSSFAGGNIVASAVLACYAVFGFLMERGCLSHVYASHPSLAEKKANEEDKQIGIDETRQSTEESAEKNLGPSGQKEEHRGRVKELLGPKKLSFASSAKTIANDFKLYFSHPIATASLSMACLYMTVLSFGGAMISWLVFTGYNDAVIMAMRGAAVFMGFAATFTTPALVRRWGCDKTALSSVWIQFFFLLPVAVAIIWISRSSEPKVERLRALTVGIASVSLSASASTKEGSSWHDHHSSWKMTRLLSTTLGEGEYQANVILVPSILLFAGMALSRWALWSFDLSHTQIMQERVTFSRPTQEVEDKERQGDSIQHYIEEERLDGLEAGNRADGFDVSRVFIPGNEGEEDNLSLSGAVERRSAQSTPHSPHWKETGQCRGRESSPLDDTAKETGDRTSGYITAENDAKSSDTCPSAAGVIHGIHFSFCNLGDVLSNLMTIIWFRPSQFWFPSVLSMAMVALSALLFTFYCHRQSQRNRRAFSQEGDLMLTPLHSLSPRSASSSFMLAKPDIREDRGQSAAKDVQGTEASAPNATPPLAGLTVSKSKP